MTLIIVIVVAVLLYVIVAYNGMIKLKNRVKEAWSDIDVQLKRRYNLIPNIVETVKGYASHEEGVLTQVTEARANAINATNVKDQGSAENMLSGALKSLFAVAENYPDLKANQNFLQLQNELVDTEDKIQSARRFYNSVTRDFNTKIQQVPAKIIASMFKFVAEEFFEIENEEEKANVEVSFNKEGTRQAEEAAPAEAAAGPVKTEEVSEEPKTEEVPAAPVAEEKPAEPEAPAEPAPEEPKEEEPKVEVAEEAPVETEEPVAEEPKAEEAPAEPEAEEKVEEEKPAEPEALAEPAAEEPKEEEAPAEPEATEPEAPAEPEATEPEAPAAEEPKEEEPVEEPAKEEAPAEAVAEEAAPAEEEKPTDEPSEEEPEKPAEEEEKKPEKGSSGQTTMPL